MVIFLMRCGLAGLCCVGAHVAQRGLEGAAITDKVHAKCWNDLGGGLAQDADLRGAAVGVAGSAGHAVPSLAP